MNMEYLTASLHAGLIQRARPARVVPLRDDAGVGRATVVPLRASDIARARPASPSVDIERPAIARVLGRAPAGVEPSTEQTAGVPPARRFGLTVRVSPALRERLRDARERTGRTGQDILHDALAAHLAALERRQADC